MNSNLVQDSAVIQRASSVSTLSDPNWGSYDVRESDASLSNFWVFGSSMPLRWRSNSAPSVKSYSQISTGDHLPHTHMFAPNGDFDLRDLYERYVIKEASMSDFLRAHRSLFTLLVEIASALRSSFGEEPILGLEVVNAGDEGPILRAAVSWSGSIENAETALKDFDDKFWLSNCGRASGHVVVTYELT